MRKTKLLTWLVFGLLFMYSRVDASPPPASQQMGGIDRTRELEARSKRLTAQIQKPRKKPGIEEEKTPAEAVPVLPSEKTLIKKIVVTGATILGEKEIGDIVAPFENKELPLSEMQKVADLITDAYRTKGYITSRAYIPPQKIEGNQFEIKVVEGKMGDVDVKGNRYYKSSLFKKKLT